MRHCNVYNAKLSEEEGYGIGTIHKLILSGSRSE